MTTRRHFTLTGLLATVSTAMAAPAFALNPQPLPPKSKVARGGDRMLNPQPLPPKEKFTRGDRALSPQPLPPKDNVKIRSMAR